MSDLNLPEILKNHQLWLNDEGGERANLTRANLTGANLSEADLSGANLTGANLYGANLTGANLSEADLSGANLTGADLYGADLSGANLSGAAGNMGEIKSLFLDRWPVTYTATVMQIGCQRHSIAEWFGFSDERISNMDSRALEWWKKHRSLIEQAVALCPATPTGPQNKEPSA